MPSATDSPRTRATEIAAADLQDEIVQTLANVDDHGQKAVLLLMMRGFNQIRDEIKSMRADIPGLREAVLNGHATVHHEDHEWIAEMRVVEAKRAEACNWCARKMAEDLENAASKRKIRDGVIEKALWAALIFLAGAVLGAVKTSLL
jgi:hypothetical protein